MRLAEPEVGELVEQAPEQRRVLPGERGRGPAVAGRGGREQHGGADGLAAARAARPAFGRAVADRAPGGRRV